LSQQVVDFCLLLLRYDLMGETFQNFFDDKLSGNTEVIGFWLSGADPMLGYHDRIVPGAELAGGDEEG
jgi:hypothetical protein